MDAAAIDALHRSEDAKLQRFLLKLLGDASDAADAAQETYLRLVRALGRTEIERIRDFIILHYHLNQRADGGFWDRCRTMAIPDSLAERIAAFRDGAVAWQASDDLFRVDSWVQVMLGQRLEPRRHHPLGAIMPRERLAQALGDLRAGVAAAAARLPSHQDFLDAYCPEAAPRQTGSRMA